MASLEGQTLGQYKVIGQMGSGGMATVYKAYHPRLDRYVAIKMLHEAFQEDKNFLARFEREAQIVAKLEHPHIVPVFDFDEFNGRPYLVMKYIEGHTLKAELEDHPLTIEEILRIMPPIGEALDYAHRQGVLHRDIKPSNIILDTNGTPYLTDFGLARIAQLGDSTLSQDVLLGTPHYISPEQAMGNRDLNSRTDLYSLGVVLYELVVGRVPFSADTPFAVIHDQIYRPLPKPSSINPEIPAQIDAVLEKALAKAPADRYATASEMIAAFRAAVEQSGITTLNPERDKLASKSLDQLREQENQKPPIAAAIPPTPAAPIPPAPSVAAPVPPPAPSQAQPRANAEPFDDEDEQDERSNRYGRGRGFGPPGGFPMPPSPHSRHDVRKAKREARREAKRTIEAQFDFSDAGRALGQAGSAVRSALEEISSSWDNSRDPDLMPADDESAIRMRVEQQFNKRKEFIGNLSAFVMVNIVLWIIYGVSGGILGFPWPLIVMFGWGAGLAAHGIETYYATGKRSSRRLRIIQGEFYRQFGPDWPQADRKELRRIRDRAVQPITKRREFADHLAVYICINIMLWIIYGTTGILSGFPWPLIVMFGWGIGLVFHGAETVMTGSSRENAVQRAIEQERERMYDEGEKPKRAMRSDDSREVRLTEDGEFTESMVEEINHEEKQKRSGR